MPKTKTSKEEVLSRIIPILRIRGVQNSSMNELAKACGIQKSHFYYYFNNKEELIKEVLSTVYSYFHYNFFRIIDSKSIILENKVSKIIELLDQIFNVSSGGCIMANTALETMHLNPSYKNEIQSFFGDFILGLQKLLEFNYSSEESRTYAEQIVQDIEGGILLTQVYNDQKYVNNAISRMKKIIIK